MPLLLAPARFNGAASSQTPVHGLVAAADNIAVRQHFPETFLWLNFTNLGYFFFLHLSLDSLNLFTIFYQLLLLWSCALQRKVK